MGVSPDAAGEVRAPCLVPRDGNDRIVPEDAAKELAALPLGEYQALDHPAHTAEYNTPDLFVAATLEFIAQVEKEALSPPLGESEMVIWRQWQQVRWKH